MDLKERGCSVSITQFPEGVFQKNTRRQTTNNDTTMFLGYHIRAIRSETPTRGSDVLRVIHSYYFKKGFWNTQNIHSLINTEYANYRPAMPGF